MKAFPHTYDQIVDGHVATKTNYGMDLRDWFAGQAMMGAIAHGLFNADKGTKDSTVYISTIAYWYADEMMKAREQ